MESWLEILEGVRQILGLHDTRPILDWAPIDQVWKYGGSPSFSLGTFPRTVFLEVRSQLEARGIEFFIPREPKETEVPVLFMVDGVDYIIADDFNIDLPEFDHKDEWFRPA